MEKDRSAAFNQRSLQGPVSYVLFHAERQMAPSIHDWPSKVTIDNDNRGRLAVLMGALYGGSPKHLTVWAITHMAPTIIILIF